MKIEEHLLTIAEEEAIEVAAEALALAQRASKALRFGMLEVQEGQALNNRARFLIEFADLCGAIEKMLPGLSIEEIVLSLRADIDAKKSKIDKFLDHSRAQGTLE